MKLSECEIVGDVPPELKCVECKHVLVDPMQCQNGHLYCSKCKHKTGISVPSIVHKMLGEIIVMCPLKCEWTGYFKTVNIHAKTECGNRKEDCLYCEESVKVKERVAHDDICIGKHTKCTFCDITLQRGDIPKHSKYCSLNPARMVSCACGTEIAVAEQSAHIASDIVGHFVALQTRLDSLSTHSFSHSFLLSRNGLKQTSDIHTIGSIDWYLFYDAPNHDIGLCARNTVREFKVQRTILLSLKCDTIIIDCSEKPVMFRNDGTMFHVDSQWKQLGYGCKVQKYLLDDNKHVVTCTIQILK